MRNLFTVAYKIFLLSILLILAGTSPAQTGKKVSYQTPTDKLLVSPSPACSGEYAPKINQIRLYLEKVKSYQNQIIRGRSTIDLNSVLWECDQEFARNSFLFLWQSLGSEIENLKIKKNDTATNTQDELKNLNRSLSVNKFLQQYLISRLQNLDTVLAKQLSKNFTSEEKGLADFLSLEENFDVNNLTQLQLNALSQFVRTSPLFQSIPFLFDLRKQNAAVADQLFSELLFYWQNNSSLSLDDLMLLGTYLYTSRIDLNADWRGSYTYSTLPAAGVGMVLNLTVERANAKKSLVVSYLCLVAKFLLIPTATPLEKTRRYVFGRIMLAHIYGSAPEINGTMQQALQIHLDGVPDSFRAESFYDTFRQINNSSEIDFYEKNLEDLEKTIGSDNRDDKAVRIASLLFRKAQYERIDKVAGYISDIDKRNSVLDTSRYTQAVRFIENNKTDEAGTLIRKMNSPSLKALVGFRLIQYLQADKNNASNSIDQYVYDVIADARKGEDEYSPILLLALAKIVYKKDEGLAYDLITTAVKKLNNQTENTPKWQIDIPTPTLGIPSVSFTLKKIQGLNISESLSFLIKESNTNLEEVILDIKNEKTQSEAVLLLAKHYLSEAKKKTAGVKNNAR
jgi:hypothetical protein